MDQAASRPADGESCGAAQNGRLYRQKEAGREVILAKGELFVGKVTFLLGGDPISGVLAK